MTYKEFKEKIKEWEEKYNHNIIIEDVHDYIKVVFEDEVFIRTISIIDKSERFVMDFDWTTHREFPENGKSDLFKIVTEFSATKIEDREDEKRFIIPLTRIVDSLLQEEMKI